MDAQSRLRGVDPERLLARHRVLLTSDLDAFDAFITGRGGGWPVEQRRQDRGPIEIDYRHVRLDQTEVGLLGLRGHMTVVASLKPSYPYLVQFPLAGSFEFELDGRILHVDRGRGVVISPPCRALRRSSPGWTLLFGLSRALVRSRLHHLLGRSIRQPLVFQPLISGAAAELIEYGLHFAHAIDGGSMPRVRSLTRALETGLADLLLELQPHSHSRAVVQVRHSSGLQRVEAVEQHVRANLALPLTLKDLAAAAECSVRALQLTFAEHCGLGPLEHVRAIRLNHARELLERAGCAMSVTAVARAVGYSNAGRLTSHYRARFGESPLQTARRARGGARLSE